MSFEAHSCSWWGMLRPLSPLLPFPSLGAHSTFTGYSTVSSSDHFFPSVATIQLTHTPVIDCCCSCSPLLRLCHSRCLHEFGVVASVPIRNSLKPLSGCRSSGRLYYYCLAYWWSRHGLCHSRPFPLMPLTWNSPIQAFLWSLPPLSMFPFGTHSNL